MPQHQLDHQLASCARPGCWACLTMMRDLRGRPCLAATARASSSTTCSTRLRSDSRSCSSSQHTAGCCHAFPIQTFSFPFPPLSPALAQASNDKEGAMSAQRNPMGGVCLGAAAANMRPSSNVWHTGHTCRSLMVAVSCCCSSLKRPASSPVSRLQATTAAQHQQQIQ